MKPTIPEVLPRLQAYFRRTGELAGGIFHIMLDDGNCDAGSAAFCLEEAKKGTDQEAIDLAWALWKMSPTQRKKLAALPWRPPVKLDLGDPYPPSPEGFVQ